jgi:hypothetical protein
MLSRMAPSSPPEKRTLHLLKTPDILCANDNRLSVSDSLSNNPELTSLVLEDQCQRVGQCLQIRSTGRKTGF